MSFLKGLTSGNRTPKDYESVEDHKDLHIPVQSEEAFEHGITFKAKYIGTEEIAKPSSRVEIVSSMRRIRYEYKYRNIKKRKVFIDVSVEGIRVTLWKKKRKAQDINFNDQKLFVMHYPINRVFYVSHDSQDLKILSYIARGEDGIFRCSVFKALKKSQAMQVVRTIGQAFEVCHKINIQRQEGPDEDQGTETSDKKPLESEDDDQKLDAKQSREATTDGETDIDDVGETDIDDPASPVKEIAQRAQSTMVTDLDQINPPVPPKVPLLMQNGDTARHQLGPFSIAQLQQLYHQQLQQAVNEAEAAKAELGLFRDKLRVETEARMESQARVHKLLAQNRELIVSIQKLMSQLQESHSKVTGEAIDESWLLEMNTSDSLFKSGTPPNLPPLQAGDPGFVDFQSSVYDNVHNQFAHFEQTASSSPFVNSNDFMHFTNKSEGKEASVGLFPGSSQSPGSKPEVAMGSKSPRPIPQESSTHHKVVAMAKKAGSSDEGSEARASGHPPAVSKGNRTPSAASSQGSPSNKSRSSVSGSEGKSSKESKAPLNTSLPNGSVSSGSERNEHNLSKEIMTTFSDELYQLGLSHSKSYPSASFSSTGTSQESIRRSGTLPEGHGYEPLIDMD